MMVRGAAFCPRCQCSPIKIESPRGEDAHFVNETQHPPIVHAAIAMLGILVFPESSIQNRGGGGSVADAVWR